MKDDMFGYAYYVSDESGYIRKPFSEIVPDHSNCNECPTERTIMRWINESFIKKHLGTDWIIYILILKNGGFCLFLLNSNSFL